MASYDLVIKGGAVVDGTGNPWFRADVAVEGTRIAAIGDVPASAADEVIDARGKYVTPGFVDIHTHSDLTLMSHPRAESAVMQGVTTHCTGNCGFSPAPVDPYHLGDIKKNWGWTGGAVDWSWRSFGEYLDRLQGDGLGINVAPLLGHHALRLATLGYEDRAPTNGELATMGELAAAAMRDGAFGMSTGLVYPPGCFARTEEVMEICRTIAKYGGIYTSHIRGERETIVEAVKEAIAIGEGAGVPVQISHNCPKYGGWGKLKETLPTIEAARARGLDVTIDNDVHTDLGPSLQHALPQWMEALGTEGIVEYLKDGKQREQVKRQVREDRLPLFGPSGLLKHGAFDRITIYRADRHPELVGKTVQAIAKARGRDAFDTYLDLIVEEGGKVWAIFDYISEEEIVTLLKHPLVMICSDGAARGPPGQGGEMGFISFSYGPCDYGEYPGVLERYVRERSVLRLEEAIRKMTSFPAQRLGLADRGILRPGMAADVTVLDLARVKDRATNLFPHTYPFENVPHQFPEGIEQVLVNGRAVVRDGNPTGAVPGRVLRHTPPRAS